MAEVHTLIGRGLGHMVTGATPEEVFPMAGKGVVVPLDGSQVAESAVPVGAELAQRLRVPLTLVHILDEGIEDQGERARARGLFAGYAAKLHPGATVVVESGVVAKAILQAAKGAEFVVLASHGRGGLKANIIGSIADKVVRGASVPTLVLPLGASPSLAGRPVLVALDGSETAERGLAAARRLATVFESTVALVRAYSVPPPAGIEFVAYPVDLATTLQEAAEAYLGTVAKDGERTFARLASSVEAITAVANEVDAGLIVMTSHGKGLAQRIALGSTTDRALHSIERPMLVVPAAGD